MARFIQSMALAGRDVLPSAPVSRLYCQTVMTRSGCGTGKRRMNNASATLTIAVVAPIPIAKTSRAIAVKPGALSSIRTP